VRQTEELVRRKREEEPAPRAKARLSPDLQDVEAQLRGVLATKVGIVRTRRGGRVVIDFYSDEELDRLYQIITRGAIGEPEPLAASAYPDTRLPETT
jgi:ParB family chromosome partitioning protein